MVVESGSFKHALAGALLILITPKLSSLYKTASPVFCFPKTYNGLLVTVILVVDCLFISISGALLPTIIPPLIAIWVLDKSVIPLPILNKEVACK